MNVSYLGGNKKFAKIICVSNNVKNTILRTIKKKKPNNIYFSEFLTRLRPNLFLSTTSMGKREQRNRICLYTKWLSVLQITIK